MIETMMILAKNLIIFLLILVFASNTSYGAELQTRNRTFPLNFIFGTATAAYQIEGGWDANGKGLNVWDTFTHNFPERISDRSNGDIACDSYNLYKEDVARLKSLGAQFYRFSISWARVLPTGEISSLNFPGVDYYHRLLDELLLNGIEPVVTMYHWDLPQYLQDLGGFANPLIIRYFETYANFLFREYGNKIKTWITFNEPKVFCAYDGGNAPSINAPGVGEYICAHHVLQAHARVYHLYKNYYHPIQQGKVGITLDILYGLPKDPNNEDDVQAAERNNQFEIGLYAHPIFSSDGDYPPIVREIVDRNSADEGREWSRLKNFDPEMIAYIKGSFDFLGLNYYTSRNIESANPDNFPIPSKSRDTAIRRSVNDSWPLSKSGWIYSVPEGFRSLLNWLKANYGDIPIMITENGWADYGEMEDDDRIIYLHAHFNAILDAIEDGVNVIGHATWSLIDNFEWMRGYQDKFGVVRVDQADPNLTRVEKKSCTFLKDVFTTKSIDNEIV